MRILLICQYFYPEPFRVNDICYQLVKEGNEVTVLTGLPNYPGGVVYKRYRWFRNRREKVNGVKVIRSWLLGRGKSKLRLALNYISFAISSTLKVFFIKKDFDIILVYQLSPVTMALPGILLKKITRRPLIIYCHDLWPESIASAGISSDSKIYKLLLNISRWIYKKADHILISSKLFEEYFFSVLKIHDSITYLPVYAEDLFQDIKYKDKDSHIIDLVFAGNIGEMQSVETIVYAANELKENKSIKFHIVGDGSARTKCEELAREMKLDNIFFHGQYPVTEMPRFYEMADAFLVTLKRNKFISYTLPNKVQSYMAAGKPIIGAIDGETKRVINDAQCGLCCPAEDYIGLANNIRYFVSQKEKWYTYGKNAKQYYNRNYSKQIFMERLNNLLENYTK